MDYEDFKCLKAQWRLLVTGRLKGTKNTTIIMKIFKDYRNKEN